MINHPHMTQEQANVQTDIAVEVRLVITTTKIIISNIDKDLHLELNITMIDVLLLHVTLDHVMIITTETLAHIVHHIDHPTDVIHVLDINPDLTLEKITFRNTLFHTDPLQNLEILDILDLAHILIQEIKLIIYNHNLFLTLSNLKYTSNRKGHCINSHELVLISIHSCTTKPKPRDYPSRLEISFFLDSGASISV